MKNKYVRPLDRSHSPCLAPLFAARRIAAPLFAAPLIAACLFLQALPSGANAAPLISIGDNTDVFFNGSSSLRWSSNVFRNEDDEVDDIVWSLSPGLEINVGRGVSNADLSIITRYDIIRYEDQGQLDVELLHIKVLGSYKTSRLDLNGSVSFDEEKSNAGDVQFTDDLIESDNLSASLNSEYRVSPKFSFGAGVRYSDKNYTGQFDDRLADRETITLPFDIFYELTPKVDLSLGYTYTHTDIEETDNLVFVPGFPFLGNRNLSDYETENHFFNIGARGNLLPKLTGFFKIGYRTRSSDDSIATTTVGGMPFGSPFTVSRGDTGMLGLDADLTWSATPKLTVGLGLSRDFGVGGEGQSTENSSVDLFGSFSLSSNWAASANLGYTLRDYTDGDREDNQYDAGLRLSYSPNQHWRFSTGYTYTENDSDAFDFSYVNHTLDLTATLRY